MGVPTPRFVGGTQSSHGQLVGPISPALLPPSDVGCRPVERANGMPRRARRGFAASGKRVLVLRRNGGGRRGERRAVHSPRAFGFPSAAYLLGLRNRLPGQCDRRTACSGCPTAELAAGF